MCRMYEVLSQFFLDFHSANVLRKCNTCEGLMNAKTRSAPHCALVLTMSRDFLEYDGATTGCWRCYIIQRSVFLHLFVICLHHWSVCCFSVADASRQIMTRFILWNHLHQGTILLFSFHAPSHSSYTHGKEFGTKHLKDSMLMYGFKPNLTYYGTLSFFSGMKSVYQVHQFPVVGLPGWEIILNWIFIADRHFDLVWSSMHNPVRRSPFLPRLLIWLEFCTRY